MEKLIELLSEIKEDVDFETCTTLIDDGILENFNSAAALLEMIERLSEE